MKKGIALLLVILMVFLTACSSNEKSSKKKSKKDLDEEIIFQENNTIDEESDEPEKEWVIATDMAFPPFTYIEEDGDLAGFEVELMEAIANDQGFSYRFDAIGFDAAITATQTGSADVLMTGVSVTEDRIEDGWIFSEPYYNYALGCAVKNDSQYNDISELKGKIVSVTDNSVASAFVDTISQENIFGAAIYKVSNSEAVQAVIDGEADACVTEMYQLNQYINKDNYDLRIVKGFVVEGDDVAAAIFDEDNQEFLTMFNEGLRNIKANGIYDKLVEKFLAE